MLKTRDRSLHRFVIAASYSRHELLCPCPGSQPVFLRRAGVEGCLTLDNSRPYITLAFCPSAPLPNLQMRKDLLGPAGASWASCSLLACASALRRLRARRRSQRLRGAGCAGTPRTFFRKAAFGTVCGTSLATKCCRSNTHFLGADLATRLWRTGRLDTALQARWLCGDQRLATGKSGNARNSYWVRFSCASYAHAVSWRNLTGLRGRRGTSNLRFCSFSCCTGPCSRQLPRAARARRFFRRETFLHGNCVADLFLRESSCAAAGVQGSAVAWSQSLLCEPLFTQAERQLGFRPRTKSNRARTAAPFLVARVGKRDGFWTRLLRHKKGDATAHFSNRTAHVLNLSSVCLKIGNVSAPPKR